MNTSEHRDRELLHEYVAGGLAGDERAQLELHLVGCAECQGVVREAAAIAAALRAMPEAPQAMANRPHVHARRSWRSLGAVTGVLAAAGLATVLLSRALNDDPVRRLGRVTAAPVFQPLAVRSFTTDADRLVDSAMVLYRGGRYEQAHALLGVAARAIPAPGVQFYLGVAALASDSAAGAIEPLRRVAARPGPYAEEARYYLAKSWLQLGHADSAAAVLASAGTGEARARALLDSVRAVIAPR